MKSIVIFGGSGFVGMHLTHMLQDMYDTIYIADIRKPRWHSEKAVPENPRQKYLYCDVRHPVDAHQFDDSIEAVVNLAAVHTSPGHEPHEYFEANILGARHICAFAEKKNINKIIFTSSISVYGPGEDEKTEDSIEMPNIPYGSSKAIAEYIHRDWYKAGAKRKLTILRPAVIFGIGEGGNFTRIANALEKHIFAYPGRKDTIKGCLYVKDICRFIIHRLETENGYSFYNFCYPEKITIRHIVKAFKKTLHYRAPEFVIPLWFINFAAKVLNIINTPFIKRMGLVPDRIIKLVKSTNISSQKLINSGFKFKYSLEEALLDWSKDCGGKTLF